MPVMPNPTDDRNGGERQRGVYANGDARAVQRTAKPDYLGAPHRGCGVAQQEMRRPDNRRGGEQPQAFFCFGETSSHYNFVICGICSNRSSRSSRSIALLRSTPSSFLPRVAGEDEGGGGNDLNGLNCWNCLNCLNAFIL